MSEKKNDENQQVFILLGSNIEPKKNMVATIKQLDQKLNLHKMSRLYRSPAVGTIDHQPKYLNSVVMIMWPKSIEELREILRQIEDSLGRKRLDEKFAPRTIDLDILLFGNRIIDRDGMKIPDPDILKYPFALQPLCDIGPTLIHPLEGKSMEELLQEATFDIQIEVVRLPGHDEFLTNH